MNDENVKSTDHDAIVTLISEVRQVRIDIRDLKDGTSATVADHENRIRRIELWGALFIGGIYIINALLGFYLLYLSTKH